MAELLVLLIGGRLIRRKWWLLFTVGLVWMALGLFFFADAFIDEIRIPPTFFAVPLAIDAAISLFAAWTSRGTERSLRIGKAVLFLAIILVVVEAPWHEDMIVGMLAGTFLVADACWRAASAWIVRYARWRVSLLGAAVEFLMGLWSFSPWPSNWAGEAGSDVGTLVIVSAAGLCGLALRIRHLPPDTPLPAILTRGWPSDRDLSPVAAPSSPEGIRGSITVHVWTPTGALVPVGIRRYVAALDEHGVVSTGHAALEAPPDIYISHYPAAEIDRTKPAFAQALRATPDNDVPGTFQRSYEEEAAAWCPSTMHVRLDGIDIAALRAFWTAYRRDATYNLTDRNCSTAVAKALDAGLEGLFETRAHSPLFLARLLFVPELWVAGVMRRRAAAMAWTPGIVLDYARALSHVIVLDR